MIALLLFLFHIPFVMEGIRGALHLCTFSIIPSLFVFIILSDCISALMLENSKGGKGVKWIVFFLGGLCGFPVGAVVCAHCVSAGLVEEREANLLLPICNNASPAFLLGVIGNGIFGDVRVGILLFFMQTFVAFCTVLTVKVSGRACLLPQKTIFLSEQLLVSLENAISAILKVCACICLFSAILSVVKNYCSETVYVWIAMLLEIGNGTAAAAILENHAIRAAMCGFACGWSGLCVFWQVLFAARSIKVKPLCYFGIKLWEGVCVALLTYIGYKFLIGT